MKKFNLLFLCLFLHNATNTIEQTVPKIFQDIRNGNKESIRQQLDNGQDCTIRDNDGNTVLHVAAQEGQTDIISMIVEYYDNCGWWAYYISGPTLPKLDDTNNNGDTPLHATLDGNNNNYEDRAKIAEYLIGKSPELMEKCNKEHFSPIFTAVKKDDPRFIRIFTAHQIDLNKHRRNGETVFTYAMKEKKPKSIQYCAQKTSLANITNNENKTPTTLALDAENLQVLELLHDSLNSFIGKDTIKPIHYVTVNSKYKALDYLLGLNISVNEPDKDGNPPLFHAVDNNDEQMINHLLYHGANIKQRNKQGDDVLAIAALNKHIPLINKLVKKYNVDLDARDNKGRTTFMRASIEQNYDVMEELLNLGANSRITDERRENSLHKAARSGDHKGASIIIKHDKSSLNDSNADGNSPLFVALQNNHIALAQTLLSAGSPLDTINKNGDTIIHTVAKANNSSFLNEVLRKASQHLINHKNNKGETAIFFAAHNGDNNSIQALINHKAEFRTITNNEGLTPIHYAAASDAVAAIKELEKHGANVTDRTKEGDTIAHIAARHGKINTIKYLQTKDGLLESCNHKGENVFSHAALHGQLDVTKMLLCEKYFINNTISQTLNSLKNSRHHNQNVYNFLNKEHQNRLQKCQEIYNTYAQTQEIIRENKQSTVTLAENNFFRLFMYTPAQLTETSVDTLYHMTESQRTEISNTYWKAKDKELKEKINFEREIAQNRLEAQKAIAKKEADEKAKQERIRQEQQAELDRIAQANRQRAAQEQARLQEELRKQQQPQTEEERIAAQQATTIREQKAELERIAADRERAAAAQYRVELDAHSKRLAEENARAVHSSEQASIAQPADENDDEIIEEGECCIGLAVCKEEHGVQRMQCSNCYKGTARVCNACITKYIAVKKERHEPVLCPTCGKETLSEKLKK